VALSLAERAVETTKATLFANWVETTIGTRPQVIQYEDFVEVTFSPEQQQEMKGWLDQQVGRMFTSRPIDAEPPSLQIRFGDILVPWSIQYLAPAFFVTFFAGWFGRGILRK
jgi:hypothetical protein